MHDVFVSYASEDRARVEPLVRRLEQHGFSVWWDREIAHGENFHRVIEQALDAARCVVAVWTKSAIESEWVLNEASSAQRRGALVPVLLDAVEPPLAFRHLQSADLRNENTSRDGEFASLERSVRRLVGAGSAAPAQTRTRPEAVLATEASTQSTGSLASWALAVGSVLFGVAALLWVLKQLGWIGAAPTPPLAAPSRSTAQPQSAALPEPDGQVRGAPETTAIAQGSAALPAQSAAERINLLEPQRGAQIVAASEENWRRVLELNELACTILSTRSFAAVQLRGGKSAKFDTLAVHVEAEASYNVKRIGLFAADAENGPFGKVGEFEIPNYKNMREPLHEFRFAAVSARFIKLQVLDFYHGEGPNGNVCTLRLYESRS